MTQTFSPANILKKSRVYNWQLWKMMTEYMR